MFSSFRSKILLLTVGLACLGQILVFFLVLAASHKTTSDQITQELVNGGEIFKKLLDNRSRELLSSVEILTSDYGFKQAVATGDKETIESALENHGGRVEADISMLISLQGNIDSTTSSDAIVDTGFPFPDLIARASEDGFNLSTLVLNQVPYQAVIVPVEAPVKVAWVFMGFAIDQKLATSLKSLTGLDVSFWASDGSTQPFITSTLPPQSYFKFLEDYDLSSKNNLRISHHTIDDEEFLTLTLHITQATGTTVAILQESLSKALIPYYQLRFKMFLLITLSLLLSILVGFMIARSVTRPVKTLVNAIKLIENGNYNTDVASSSIDEFNQLADAFNKMQHGISEREAQILHQAHHDPLTGLPNRVLANDRLEQAIERAKRQGSRFTLFMMDLNRFKEINDTMGHHTGDLVLTEVAIRSASVLRACDTVARLGGDEYLIILEKANLDDGRMVAEKLNHAMQAKFNIDSMSLSLNLSIGICVYPEHGTEPQTLLRRADIAMYDAKSRGKTIEVYQPGRDEGYLRQLAIISDLKSAVDNNELVIHYQPKLDVKTGRINQAEALVRWMHPDHGFMPPDEFIPLAEQSGHMSKITNWVLRSTIKQCHEWKKQNIHVNVAINLSASDLLLIDLTEIISSSLREYTLPPDMLTLEITESAVMRDTAYSIKVLNKLRQSGIRLSIDDFGTGYSSLAQLKSLPVNELKIDKSFVMDMITDADDEVIVRSTIELGHNMGLKVVAEGVENQATLSLLKLLGCDKAQGYFISKPLPVKEFGEWIQNENLKQIYNDTQADYAQMA